MVWYKWIVETSNEFFIVFLQVNILNVEPKQNKVEMPKIKKELLSSKQRQSQETHMVFNVAEEEFVET